MPGSQLVLVTSSAAFMLTSGAMGLRLLWLSRTTGGLPERLIGAAFVIMTWFALPIMAASGMGRVQVSEIRMGLLVASTAFLWIGFTCMVSFTRETFRPQQWWAGMFTMLISSCMAGACCGLIATLHTSPGEMSTFQAGKLWTGLLRVPMLSAFAWGAFEGFQQYGMARKRARLGLGNPIVRNRFLLWGLVGLSQVFVHTTSLFLHIRDIPMLGAPLGIFVVASGSLLGSVMMLLLFLPPASYVRFVERRAGAGGS
jgi:hypothetical protein